MINRKASSLVPLIYFIALTPMFAPGSCSGDSLAAVSSPGHSTSLDRQIEEIARSRPCAATALLYLYSELHVGMHGIIDLDGAPSTATVGMLLDRTGAKGFKTLSPALQRSPYSASALYVRVYWSVSALGATGILFTTQAELVNSAGASLEPQHLIEPRTHISLSKADLRILK